MTKSKLLLTLLATWMLAACGGSQPPAAEAPVPEKQHQHPKLPPTIEAFHDVLSPIWHAQGGDVRVGLACEQAATLGQRATAIVTEPTPAEARDQPDVWKIATDALVGQVNALAAACGVEGRLDVEARLKDVHEGFHKVASTVAKMGDHGNHQPPGGTGQHGGPSEH
jgi:hypothetical protein